jgi:hypothetical protein
MTDTNNNEANNNDTANAMVAFKAAYIAGERSDKAIHDALIEFLVDFAKRLDENRSGKEHATPAYVTEQLVAVMDCARAINVNGYRFVGISKWLKAICKLDVTVKEMEPIIVRFRSKVSYDANWLQACKATTWADVVKEAVEKKIPDLPISALSGAVAKLVALHAEGFVDDETVNIDNIMADLKSAILKGRKMATNENNLKWISEFKAQERAA